MPRKNKNKKEIVSDIQLVQDAERRRSLIREFIFPYLVEMKETIGYSKVFLQSFNGLVNSVFDETRKTTTIGHLTPKITIRLNELFKGKDQKEKEELSRYLKLVAMLRDISIQDLTYATELSRYIDGFIIKNKDKESIEEIDINAILG